MSNMPILRIRRIGNSLGLTLPKDYVREKGLKRNDFVLLEIERVARLEETFGVLRKFGLSTREWNDLTNEGEDL